MFSKISYDVEHSMMENFIRSFARGPSLESLKYDDCVETLSSVSDLTEPSTSRQIHRKGTFFEPLIRLQQTGPKSDEIEIEIEIEENHSNFDERFVTEDQIFF
jgi:hypothetical protein